jgi:predicted lipoprotein with Yx(FWY)xxD motif
VCAQLWLPAYVSSAAVPAGSAPGVTVVRRSADRRWQLAYCGQPLYEFGEDAMAGQITGNGTQDQFGGTTFTWHVATAAARC